ncbi:hypothetical protein BGY98DRAFT_1099658 [Russula aff. rugulosa BPL654]|nr:hypothetical protein BGY98DRAFT_1099658 [Russula aff. rugulosa BPL654]
MFVKNHPGTALKSPNPTQDNPLDYPILRADNVPSIKKHLFKNRMFFVTVSNLETTAKTADVPVERQMANWNQNLDPFLVQPSSRLTLCLYAKRSSHPDILIGTHEMRIPLSSQSDIQCVLGNGAGGAVRPTHPVTLHIVLYGPDLRP